MEGYVYPNETEVYWSLLIVLYPYITGLVAGAFIVSSLYHVFGIAKLKPVARFSLVTALSFALVAPLPLLIHLGRPERGFEIFWTPHMTSAMAGFGYVWLFYTTLLVSEGWLIFRKDIVYYALKSSGFKKLVYSALALDVYDLSDRSLSMDAKLIKILATVGIPAAALLHGYVGFIFGSVKANPWWSTPLMPIIFLMSAIVSGIALLIVLYTVVTRLRKQPVDHDCINSMAGWLLGFLLIAVTLESLEVLSMLYESEESWEIIFQLMTQKIALSYFGIQLALGTLIPALVLGTIALAPMTSSTKSGLALVAAALVLIGIFAMRWNVVIGGQLFSKSLRGFKEYTPPLGTPEGILVSAGLLVLPLLIFTVISFFLPPWAEQPTEAVQQPRTGMWPGMVRGSGGLSNEGIATSRR